MASYLTINLFIYKHVTLEKMVEGYGKTGVLMGEVRTNRTETKQPHGAFHAAVLFIQNKT